MGLNDCYMNVKSNLLLRDPLPDVKTAYSVLSREESHRGLTNSENKPQTSVFLAQTNSHITSSNNAVSDSNVQRKGNQTNFSNGNNSNNFSNNNRAALNPNYKCTKCHKIGYTVDKCYKIVGFPPGWKEKPFNKFHKNSANHSSLSEDTGSGSGNNMNLPNEQMMKLLSLINEKSGPEIASGNMAGASQHMTGSDDKLDNVIDVSHLNLTDLRLGIIVGTGDVYNGLYVFNVSDSENMNVCLPESKCYLSKHLWHSRLGHPSDNVLKNLKDKIDLSCKDIVSEPCDICHKAKQTREIFNDSDHKSAAIGDLVHIDLWGPFRIQSREGFKYFLTIVDDYSRAVWTYLIK
ncbi:uncharacterized protein [Rutidosis leptorrhynchoides]|uniref:uncharacterized protein n=1 Tax=Rutidosis leptorrhynchoides TaxID=125765 RepID=UPI003A99F820